MTQLSGDRAPLTITSSGNNLRAMTAAEITSHIALMAYEYSQAPSVTMTVVNSGGNLDSVSDTYYTAGTATSVFGGPHTTEAATDDIDLQTIIYDRFNQAVASTPLEVADTNNYAFPLYYDSTGNIQAMTLTDFYDTFVKPCVTLLIGGSVNNDTAGTYFVDTNTSVTNATLISSTPVFVDQRADASAYTAAGIPEALNQTVVVNNYYLHRRDYSGTPSVASLPVLRSTGNNIRQMSETDWRNMISQQIQYAAHSGPTDTRIRYRVGTSNASYTNKGTGMADTYLSGTSAEGYTTNVADGYYTTQEFPNGTPATLSTTYFQIYKL